MTISNLDVHGLVVKSNSLTVRKKGETCPACALSPAGILISLLNRHLRASMTTDSWDSFVGQKPKDKVTTLIELIEEARKRTTQKSE